MARAYMVQAGGEADRSASSGGGRMSRLRGRWRSPGIWRRGLVPAVVAVLLALAFFWHARIPNAIGNLGSLWETFLPWGGLLVPVLFVWALLRRSATALAALVLPVVAWVGLFGGLVGGGSGAGGDVTVATHNVDAENLDPAGTVRSLAASGADVLALEEVSDARADAYEKGLRSAYPHHKLIGTVGLWSKYPMTDVREVDIEMGWPRALRATVHTPQGKLAVYAAHLPSVRVEFRSGFTAGQRDGSAQALGRAISHEKAGRVVLLGDLNGTMNDRALAPITSQMRSAQGAAGDGFGFSWPAAFPMARIDQIMVKGVEPESAWTLDAAGSDHLPIAASITL
nr:endonuclease/exonuclease/phosphatase family protein [Streptomyces sulphureus]